MSSVKYEKETKVIAWKVAVVGLGEISWKGQWPHRWVKEWRPAASMKRADL